jgi:3-oxoacyl-[acyl-carrier-protein] synthase II
MSLITGIGWVTVSGMGHGRESKDFALTAGRLPRISRKSVFEKPYRHFGRMDEFSRLGLAAIAFALKDAGLDEWTQMRDMGILASTVYGCLQTDIDYFDTVMPGDEQSPSPALFSYTLPNCFLGEAACHFGLTGPAYVINEQYPSGLSAVCTAMDGIACGEFESTLAGICDLDCPADFPLEERGVPGAVFLVIEKTPRSGCLPYGSLTMDRNGEIMFNEKKVEDLVGLVKECLTKTQG